MATEEEAPLSATDPPPIYYYRLWITAGLEPLSLDPNTTNMTNFFKAEQPDYVIDDTTIVMNYPTPHFNVIHLINDTTSKYNETWERIVRPVGRYVPALRGCVLVVTRQDPVNWQMLAHEIADFFEDRINPLQEIKDLHVE